MANKVFPVDKVCPGLSVNQLSSTQSHSEKAAMRPKVGRGGVPARSATGPKITRGGAAIVPSGHVHVPQGKYKGIKRLN